MSELFQVIQLFVLGSKFSELFLVFQLFVLGRSFLSYSK